MKESIGSGPLPLAAPSLGQHQGRKAFAVIWKSLSTQVLSQAMISNGGQLRAGVAVFCHLLSIRAPPSPYKREAWLLAFLMSLSNPFSLLLYPPSGWQLSCGLDCPINSCHFGILCFIISFLSHRPVAALPSSFSQRATPLIVSLGSCVSLQGPV